MNLAPVLLFTYKRVEPLKKTILALQDNFLSKYSELYIFSDGPKNEDDKCLVDEVRLYLMEIGGFKNVVIKKSDKNKGLARSIIDGTSEMMQQFGKVIVLEDDLLTTPNFLNFMNDALDFYQNNTKVFSVSGYSFNLGMDSGNSESYFLNRGWSWGWATWADRWEVVDWEMKTYDAFKKDKRERKSFAKGGSDLNAMLDKQMNGTLDSWAIRWFFNQFKLEGLTLYPKLSKIYNNGFDEFATHTNGSANRYIPFLDTMGNVGFTFPDEVVVTDFYQKAFLSKMGIRSRLISKIETIFKKYTR